MNWRDERPEICYTEVTESQQEQEGKDRAVTKGELIEEVARRHARYSVRDVEVMVNAVFASLTAALARGEGIELRGFGGFAVRARRARQGRNPRTGAVVTVPAKKALIFKVAKELRRRVDDQGVSSNERAEQVGK